MTKRLLTICFLSFSLAVFCMCQKGIPRRIGQWRVEVVPAGNDFQLSPDQKAADTALSEKVIQTIESVVPDFTQIAQWEVMDDGIYKVISSGRSEEYIFTITRDGRILKLGYERSIPNLDEDPDKHMLKGTKKPLSLSEIPENTLRTLELLHPGSKPSQAWTASILSGPRIVIVVDEMVYIARLDGQIQGAVLVANGALHELERFEDMETKSREEILVEAEDILGAYKSRFNIQTQINKLTGTSGPEQGFRFVVIGDSRSNQDLWNSVITHIGQLKPEPDFIIHTGDIVNKGYAVEYANYFLPPLLKLDLPVFVSLGNHDDGKDGYALEYQILFGGKNTLNYFFDYRGIRFIIFDNATNASPFEERFQWLEDVLLKTPDEYKIIVSAHKPPANIEMWNFRSKVYSEGTRLTELMTRFSVDHVFFGHLHAYSTATFENVDYTVTGGAGAPIHYRYGPKGNIHHYLICDVSREGDLNQQVVRFSLPNH